MKRQHWVWCFEQCWGLFACSQVLDVWSTAVPQTIQFLKTWKTANYSHSGNYWDARTRNKIEALYNCTLWRYANLGRRPLIQHFWVLVVEQLAGMLYAENKTWTQTIFAWRLLLSFRHLKYAAYIGSPKIFKLANLNTRAHYMLKRFAFVHYGFPNKTKEK